MEQQPYQIKALGSNTIYFYDDVTSGSILELITVIQKMDTELMRDHLSEGGKGRVPVIELHIQSWGGHLHAALGMADIIRGLYCNVHSYVEGIASSAATYLSMCCAKRYITKNSFFMIHQLSGGIVGTHEEMKEQTDFHDLMMESTVDFYKRYSKLSKKKLKSILKKNIWLNASTTVEYGFADEIL